jgi:ABC-type Mn2+/Zn2+ transport system permease subunit
MAWLAEPLTYPFFVRALIVGVVIGAMCGTIGVFIVLRRMSYIGHGLAHSVLGGVAVAVTLDQSLYLGAAVAALLSALLIDRISRRHGLYPDAAIGIVTTAMFAVGVVVISLWRAVRVNLESLLFGNVLGVRPGDLVLALSVAAVFAVLVFALYKPLVFTTFDPQVAAAQGVRTGAMEVLFNVLVAAVVIASVRVLGVLLIAAAVVVPAATARLLTRSFGVLLLLSTAFGALFSVGGLYLSFWVDAPSGATIVLLGAAVFAGAAGATAAAARLRVRAAQHGDADRTRILGSPGA